MRRVPILAAWACVATAMACASPARADDGALLVGVSWSNFQEERWKTDQAALEAALAAAGARVLSADAHSSTEKQIADVESLLARGADVLVLVAHDADAVLPAVALARAEGVPVVAYDRLVQAPGVFYVSFDNREVGRLQARAVQAAQPRGRYVFIKGSAQDPNADFVHAGQLDVLRPAIERGEIEVVGDQYVDRWLPEVAQRTMEQILTATADGVDAVVCSNDAMAGGVIAALAGRGLAGIPVSGQDGDHAALNRVARGLQTVSVWKDARELGRVAAEVAVALAAGTPGRAIPGARRWGGGSRGADVDAILLEPVPVTRANLGVVIEAGWAPRRAVCRGVDAAAPGAPAACR